MRAIVTSKELYDYSELDSEAKESVKNWYLEECREPDIFDSIVSEDLNVIFGENNLNIEYSLGYCQGDGLNIYGDISVMQIINAIKDDSGYVSYAVKDEMNLTEHDIKTLIAYSELYGTVHIPRNNRMYYYCNADNIDYANECEINLDIYYSYRDIDTETLEKFNDILVCLFKNLCKRYEDMGYDYFYEIEDCDMQEVCDCNKWEFDKYGNLY